MDFDAEIIIREKTAAFTKRLKANMDAMNIKRFRVKQEPEPRSALHKKGGEVTRISIGLTKGLIMTHGGWGPEGQTREKKPFYTDPADEFSNELADTLAPYYGDTICYNLAHIV